MCCDGSLHRRAPMRSRRLRPRVAVGRHQGVRSTSHSQGTYGSPRRRVRPVQDVAHSHSPGYSQPRETVWKIAENVSARLSGGKKRPNWDSFHPSWPLSEPRFETYPEFPNSFGRGILGSSDTGSCIAPVLYGQNRPIAPYLSVEVITR